MELAPILLDHSALDRQYGQYHICNLFFPGEKGTHLRLGRHGSSSHLKHTCLKGESCTRPWGWLTSMCWLWPVFTGCGQCVLAVASVWWLASVCWPWAADWLRDMASVSDWILLVAELLKQIPNWYINQLEKSLITLTDAEYTLKMASG